MGNGICSIQLGYCCQCCCNSSPLRFLALLCVVISFVCLILHCYKLFVISVSMQLALSIESSLYVVALVATVCSFQLKDFRNCSFVVV